MQNNTIILGSGYTASYLMQNMTATMTGKKDFEDRPNVIKFILEDESTWENLPKAENVVITFKITSFEIIEKFYDFYLKKIANIIMYSSISCYKANEPDQKISEQHPLDFDNERVLCEEFLRDKGALILNLGLIYGPGRELKRWLEEGRIKNGLKLINLSHVKDIAFITQFFLQNPQKNQRINVTDGQPKKWNEFAKLANIQLSNQPIGIESKWVVNSYLKSFLPKYHFINPCELFL